MHIHYNGLKFDFNDYEVKQELQVLDETFIIISVGDKKAPATFKVKPLSYYAGGYTVEWAYNNHIYKYFVLVRDRKGDTYTTIILEKASGILVEVLAAKYTNDASFFGYSFKVTHAPSSKEIEDIVANFKIRARLAPFNKPIQAAAGMAAFGWFQTPSDAEWTIRADEYSSNELTASISLKEQRNVFRGVKVVEKFKSVYTVIVTADSL